MYIQKVVKVTRPLITEVTNTTLEKPRVKSAKSVASSYINTLSAFYSNMLVSGFYKKSPSTVSYRN